MEEKVLQAKCTFAAVGTAVKIAGSLAQLG